MCACMCLLCFRVCFLCGFLCLFCARYLVSVLFYDVLIVQVLFSNDTGKNSSSIISDADPPPPVAVLRMTGTSVQLQSDTNGAKPRASPLSLKVVSMLGKGGFGSVYGVEDLATETKFALKVLICKNSHQLKSARREIVSLGEFS